MICGARLVDAERVDLAAATKVRASGGCRPGRPRRRRTFWKPSGRGRRRERERHRCVGRDLQVIRTGETATAAPTAECDGAVVQAVELDIDREVGDRAREWHVDLADEVRLADVGVLVADDAGVLVDVGVISKVVIDRRLQRLDSQILDEVVGQAVGARGEDAGEIAVERVADQVGHARRSYPLAQDDDRVIVGGHLGLGQVRCS